VILYVGPDGPSLSFASFSPPPMKLLSIAILALLNAGCASIVSKTVYPVTVTSNPDACRVVIRQNGAVIHEGTTPFQISLKTKGAFFQPATYDVQFSKRGMQTQTLTLTGNLNGWYLGNLLFGGLLGMLVIDPATGAMWRLPENLHAWLNPMASLEDDMGHTIHLVDRASLPEALVSQLVALP
jgi:hypothetical protein